MLKPTHILTLVHHSWFPLVAKPRGETICVQGSNGAGGLLYISWYGGLKWGRELNTGQITGPPLGGFTKGVAGSLTNGRRVSRSCG